jgi:hypothetical protein
VQLLLLQVLLSCEYSSMYEVTCCCCCFLNAWHQSVQHPSPLQSSCMSCAEVDSYMLWLRKVMNETSL